jgi:hypothetical protein
MTLVTPRSIRVSIKPPLPNIARSVTHVQIKLAYDRGQEHRQTGKEEKVETVYLRCFEVYKIALAGASSLISLAVAVVAVVLEYSGS